MNAKRTLVSFLAIATLLVLATSMVSAYSFTPVDATSVLEGAVATVEINGIEVTNTSSPINVVAGDTITIDVEFTANTDIDETSNVKIRAELQSDQKNVETTIVLQEVMGDRVYSRTLILVVPEDLDGQLKEDMYLSLRIWNGEYESETYRDIVLGVQKPSYDLEVRSILVSSSLVAGQLSPVDVVLENTGYNDLDGLEVTVRILELGVERTAYFGDLAVGETSDDDDDSVRVYLEVPYNVASGLYTLEVVVANEDFSNSVERQVAVTNGFPEVVLASGDNLLVLNPTNNLKVYKVVYPSEDLTIAIQAGSSKLVSIETPEGEYTFDVFVFDGDQLVGTVNYSGVSESQTLASPVVVLTVILAVIFVVLLIVMIVLMTKKPEKAEEFGESYY